MKAVENDAYQVAVGVVTSCKTVDNAVGLVS